MDTLKMVWRTALFLGAVTVVFVLKLVGREAGGDAPEGEEEGAGD